jgi:hypothetical protein
MTETDHPVTRALDAQGTLQPGQDGYWRVWGATVGDIQAADLIMVKPKDGEITEHEVAEIVPEEGILAAMYLRFIDGIGEDVRIGRLCPVVVLRKGTHRTLARSVR